MIARNVPGLEPGLLERLAMLAEEAGETGTASALMMRAGPQACLTGDIDRTPAMDLVRAEAIDMLAVSRMMQDAGDFARIDPGEVHVAACRISGRATMPRCLSEMQASLLAEEAGKVGAIAGKTLRHGPDSYHPSDPAKTPNTALIRAAMIEVQGVLHLMQAAGSIRRIEPHDIAAAIARKLRWSHHQQPEPVPA